MLCKAGIRFNLVISLIFAFWSCHASKMVKDKHHLKSTKQNSTHEGFSNKNLAPIRGEGCEIFRPFVDIQFMNRSQAAFAKLHAPPIFASPESFLQDLESMFDDLDGLTENNFKNQTILSRARFAYTEMLSTFVSGKVFAEAEKRITPKRGKVIASEYNETRRTLGDGDWTYLGLTMTGTLRIKNTEMLLRDVFANKIPGGFMETGVWRGGLSIYARGVMRVYDEGLRMSYVCDSFSGLPPGEAVFGKADMKWDQTPYLEVSEVAVERNFRKLRLLDPSVVFVKGFFNNTMPVLQKRVDKLAVLRLDGDMYQSTVDVLYFMYEKLSVGGYVIIDDWFGFPAKIACEDFFQVHGITPKIVVIDINGVYWQKTQEIVVQMNRYDQRKFKMGDTLSA